MIETTTIARPYAKAAFEAARDSDSIESWSQFFGVLTEMLAQPTVRQLFDSPQLTRKQAADVLTDVLNDTLGDTFLPAQRQFLSLIAENDRFSALDDIQRQFEAQKDQYQGVAEALIATALPMDDAALAPLVRTLEARFGCKIRTRVTVEPDLIGGVKIAVGDEVIDASVRGELDRMAVALTQ